jgi:hypothetical protein
MNRCENTLTRRGWKTGPAMQTRGAESRARAGRAGASHGGTTGRHEALEEQPDQSRLDDPQEDGS